MVVDTVIISIPEKFGFEPGCIVFLGKTLVIMCTKANCCLVLNDALD